MEGEAANKIEEAPLPEPTKQRISIKWLIFIIFIVIGVSLGLGWQFRKFRAIRQRLGLEDDLLDVLEKIELEKTAVNHTVHGLFEQVTAFLNLNANTPLRKAFIANDFKTEEAENICKEQILASWKNFDRNLKEAIPSIKLSEKDAETIKNILVNISAEILASKILDIPLLASADFLDILSETLALSIQSIDDSDLKELLKNHELHLFLHELCGSFKQIAKDVIKSDEGALFFVKTYARLREVIENIQKNNQSENPAYIQLISQEKELVTNLPQLFPYFNSFDGALAGAKDNVKKLGEKKDELMDEIGALTQIIGDNYKIGPQKRDPKTVKGTTSAGSHLERVENEWKKGPSLSAE